METEFSGQDDISSKNFILRNYQMNIIEHAKKQNSIIFLPTGSGKTLIAVHVLCSRKSEITGTFPERAKRVFFVAPTKVLVYQLHKTISIQTKFKVGMFVGDMLVNSWNKEKWEEQFKEYQVIVLTGEILRQILDLNFILPSQISLIVFDECHHAILQHPYRLIMQLIAKEPLSTAPLLLGLSAVLLNANPKKKHIRDIITDLTQCFRGTILTESQLSEVQRFAACPQEKLIQYNSSISFVESFLPLYVEVIEILKCLDLTPPGLSPIPKASKPYSNKNRARRLSNWFATALETLQEYGLYCGTLSILYYIILIEKHRLMSTDPEEIQVLVYCRTALHKLRHILLNVMGEETVQNIIKFSSHKTQALLNLLLRINHTSGKKYTSTLIFVRQKVTAIVIATLLKRLRDINDGFSFLKPEFIIGSTIFDNETLLHELNNEEIIKEFCSQNLNTLVSTNLLEEGVDITACNVVISFDFPVSYASYFQSKGRARDKDGFHYIFVKEEEFTKKKTLLDEYKKIEEELYKIIINDKSQFSDQEILTIDDEDLTSMAIRAVYRYCSKLPQDKYSFLSPIAWYNEVDGGKKASVQLPINCPIQDIIEGKVMGNSKLAKKSVFLEVLNKLKELGELDENLNPTPFGVKAQYYDYLFPHFKKEKIEKNSPLPGSKKRRQIYEVKFAKSLSECLPQPGMKAYLHVIDFAINFEEVEREDKLVIQEVLRSPVTFAILSSQKLCKICQFPMFLSMGQIDCNLLINHDEVVLSKSELEDIKLCHFAIFQKVLNITKPSQIFDNRNKGHSFYIVPVKKSEFGKFILDWEIIRCDFCKNNKSAVVRYNPFRSRAFKSNMHGLKSTETFPMSDAIVPANAIDGRRLWGDSNYDSQFVMSETEYKHFVISPNYRNIHPPQMYIVNKFCTNLSPLSPFPRSTFVDYCAYYQDKYAIEITNLKQPLMKVAFVFSCSNFNKPKFYENQEKGKGALKSNEELLVPELCDLLLFDRRYWLKAVLLPTALNRICHLYCIEEFRRKIVKETGLGEVELPTATEWKPLEVDLHLNENEDENEKIPESLNKALPLSEFKSKSKVDGNFIDPKRNMYEVGACDLEYLVTLFGNFKPIEEEIIERVLLPHKLQGVDPLIQLKHTEGISIPSLGTLKGTQSKLGPDLAQLVQTFTSSAANDIVNYERLEILGDAFLKFATSVFLFKNFNINEGILTFLKGKLVGNRNLLYCGLAKGFQHVLNVTDFAPLSDWNPPLFYLPEKLVEAMTSSNTDLAVIYRWDIPPAEQFSGNISEETLTKNEEIIRNYDKACEIRTNSLLPYKSIGDKSISDSVEAVIGVYLWEFGLAGGFEILMWLDILPKSLGSYSELIGKPYTPSLFPKFNLVSVMNLLNEVFYADLEETLGYQFKNKALLLEALTHPSYARNQVTDCYQRLEFLGDAIIDFLITSYIYQYCGDLKPGEVTDIRSSLVNNITFASLAVRYDFHKYLLKFSSRLNRAIEEFVTHQMSRNHVIDDNVLILLEESDCLIAEAIQVPKALGDVFESLAGAIYLDSGNSLETVWAVYYRLMKNEIDDFTKSIPKSPVRLLHEICEEKPYFESSKVDDMVRVACTVWYGNAEIKVYGFGANGKEAKRSAAKFAIKKITELKKK